MKIITLVVGEMETNCYLIGCEKTKEALIIDPGSHPRLILGTLEKNNWQAKLIILTHGHGDHMLGSKELNLPLAIHRDDEESLTDPWKNLSAVFGSPFVLRAPERILVEGDIIEVGEIKLRVIHTPGHTPGSICLLSESQDLVFTGDTLFADGVGRTDLPGGSEKKLWQSIQEKLFILPETIRIYPGHGATACLSRVKANLGC